MPMNDHSPSFPLRCLGVYVSTIFVGAFAFGVGFDIGVTKFWDTWNKGVSAAFILRL